MPIRATLFNGRVLEFPDDTPPEVVERVAQEQTNLFRAQERPEPTQTLTPAPMTPPSRSAGEVVADIGAGALSGLGSILAFPGQVVSLVPGIGGAGRVLAKPGEGVQEFAEGLKSEGLKVREALRNQAISEAEKEGILSSFATAITSTLKDPALIGSFVSEQLPLLLPPLAAARVFQILGRGAIAVAGRGLTGEAAAAATQRAAEQVNRRAYAAALGTGAAMQGADISSDAYKRAYDAAISQGMSPDDAESAATNAARLAGAGAAGVSLLTQRLPGARAIEERFARIPGSAGRLKAGLGEATAESLEEAGGALFQNLGVRTVDPNAQLLEGVGSAAGLGALGGGIFGTLLGKKGKQALAPGQMEGESIEQTINRLMSERAALTAPTAPALPTALEMIEMVNKQPGYGYSTIVKFIGSLEQLPDSPEKAQALQTANAIKDRLNVEDRERNTPTNRNVISGTDLQDLGFGTQDPVFQKLNGKDLAKPDQAVDVLKTLETELAREDLTGDRYQTLTGMMESVNAYLDQLPGSGFYAGEIEQPGVGERAPVAEPTGREPAETAGPVERGGVAPAGEPLSDSALAKAESTAPLEFETKTGDVYSVDEQGRTSSQKAPGAREVLYVAPDAASALVDAMRVRETTSVRLGYRDGNIFKTVNQRSEIPEGKQPIIGVINALDQMIDAYPAQINPAVGFTPIEQVITSAGKASTKIGNPIANIRRVINKDVLNALGIKPASARGKRLLGKDIREIKKSLRPEELETKFRELETRAKAPAKEAAEKPAKPVKPEEVAIKQRIAEIDKQLAKLLKVVLNKYGLNDVGVELAKDLEANGEYANRLIRLADNHENPLLHLRHESIHALKELGFFTPKQWQTLEQKAKDEWVNTYLKNVKHSDTQSRYDAYIDLFKQQGKTQAEADQALIEEAIADAFSYFQKAKPPAGFLASINNRLKNFFKAIKEFLGSNNLTAEDIFGKIEAGELKPAKDKNPAPAAEPPRASLRGVPSIDRERSLNAKRISPRFPTAVKATEEVLGPIRLQPDLETFKRDPVAFRYNIGLMSQYPNFTDIKGTPDQRAEQIINRMRDNLLWLYKHWDENLRNRSKLWYVGGNRIAHRWAEKYGIPPETAAAIIASLSPQKDWFQNVSLAERTLDALIFNADTRWDASMDRVFKERAWTKKFPVKQYRGKTLKEMYVPGDPKSLAKMAVWIRAWDEGHNPQTARVITPEGTFTNEIASGKTGKPIAMRAQNFAAMVKTLQILQDSDLRNFSELIGNNHKVRSFYNNIIAPFAGEDVTIDTHAVAAALMRPLGSSDLEVHHNFGSAKPAKKDKEGNILVPASKGTKNSAVTGLYGTYAMYAEAYRRAAADARILPREIQSITWEAIRGLFRPEQKQAKLKTQVNALWNQVAKGKLSGQEALEQISKLVSGIEDPAWVKSPAGSNDSRTDSSYATELPGTRVPGREPEPVPSGTGERAAGAIPKLSIRSQTQTPAFKQWFGDSEVVDKNGEPLVVYHGMPQEMEGGVFRESKFGSLGTGIYFTSDPEAAGRFATGIRGSTKESKLQGNIVPVYLRITMPFDDNFFVGNKDWQQWAASVLLRGMPRIELTNWGGGIQQQKKVQALYDKLNQNKATLRDLLFIDDTDAESAWGKEILKAVREHGAFDGIILKDSPKGFDEYVVFDPTQIKSAIGNVGTFSPTEPDIRKSLRSPQQSLRNTIPASTWNRVNMTIGQRNQKTWVQRITDAISPKNWSDFRTNALNRYEGLARIDRMKVAKMGGARLMADQSAEAAALFSDLGAGISAAAFGVHDRIGGYPVFRNGVVTIDNKNGTVKGPLAIFAPLAAYNDPDVYRLYQFWVTAQRGQRLNAEGRLTPFDAADMAEVQRINNDPQLGPMFRQIKDEWIKYNDGLVKFMEDTGVITPEASKEFRIHGDYFPMYKYMEQEDTAGPRVFSSIANVPVPKKLKGDEVNPMGDFFENVVRNTQSAIQMGIKNIAAQRATQVAVDVGSAVKLPGRPTRMEPNYYRVLENGKEVFYASSDVMFLNAIKSLQLPDLPFIGFLAAPANILRNLVTKTPDFMGANMLRDSVAAWVSSGTDITPIISTLKNFGTAIAEKSPELNALRNAGILGGYDYAQGVDVTARKFAKDLRKIAGARTAAEKAASPFTSIWEALEKGSSASDAATRMEVYKKTLAETGNEAEALFRALEVMNFNRKGRSTIIRILTAAVPFLNARMQGLDVLYRAGIRPILAKDATQREQEIAKTFWKRGMTLMALSAMYWALTHDDDEYKKQEQETRDNNWLFPSLGIKIPIPFEIGVIFKVVPERVLEYSFGSDTGKDFVDSMTRQLRSTFAFNLTPQIVLPIYEVQTNHSFFTERPIIGQGLEQVAAPYQVAPTTSRTAQGLAKAYNSIIEMLPAKVQEKFQASPMVIDYLIQGYTGTMGTYAMQAIDAVISANSDVPSASKRFEQMPVIKRFALDPQARGTVTAYYDLKNSVDEVVRTSNLLERTAQFDEYAKYLQKNVGMLATKEYVSDLEKSMKEIREMKTMIRISTLSADAKRQQLDNVEKLELALTANIQKVKKSL